MNEPDFTPHHRSMYLISMFPTMPASFFRATRRFFVRSFSEDMLDDDAVMATLRQLKEWNAVRLKGNGKNELVHWGADIDSEVLEGYYDETDGLIQLINDYLFECNKKHHPVRFNYLPIALMDKYWQNHYELKLTPEWVGQIVTKLQNEKFVVHMPGSYHFHESEGAEGQLVDALDVLEEMGFGGLDTLSWIQLEST